MREEIFEDPKFSPNLCLVLNYRLSSKFMRVAQAMASLQKRIHSGKQYVKLYQLEVYTIFKRLSKGLPSFKLMTPLSRTLGKVR